MLPPNEHTVRSPITIEVCVDSVDSALNAVAGGADRLELCANLGLGGGITPSLGLLKSVQKAVAAQSIPIMVGASLSEGLAMVRPRIGDFLYTESEIDVMLEDIRVFKQHGVHGVVLGVLTSDGRIDIERTRRLVHASLPLEVCFHRAFDMTRDAIEALRDVLAIGGISRILTSGQGTSVSKSIDTIKLLLQTAQLQGDVTEYESSGFTIMPGSGINAATCERILNELMPLGLSEVHLSGGSYVEGHMSFRREGMGMGSGGSRDWSIWETSQSAIEQVKSQSFKQEYESNS